MTRTVHGSPAAGLAGFTTLELVVAMLSAAILVITMGAMLQFGYRCWFRLGKRANMQYDGVVAMDVLSSVTRAGTNLTFAAGKLTVYFDGRPNAVVDKDTSGTNLRYQPSVSSSNRFPLVSGTLQSFNVSTNSDTATIDLCLSSGGETVSNSVVVSRRNTY